MTIPLGAMVTTIRSPLLKRMTAEERGVWRSSLFTNRRWAPAGAAARPAPTAPPWEGTTMAFEDKEAELGLLLTRMQNEPDDLHELYRADPAQAE